MSKHKQNNDGIYFLGESSTDVTGSQYLVQFGGKKILLECGLYQSKSNSYLDSYKINSKKFGFKPSEIDYLFVFRHIIPPLLLFVYNSRYETRTRKVSRQCLRLLRLPVSPIYHNTDDGT